MWYYLYCGIGDTSFNENSKEWHFILDKNQRNCIEFALNAKPIKLYIPKECRSNNWINLVFINFSTFVSIIFALLFFLKRIATYFQRAWFKLTVSVILLDLISSGPQCWMRMSDLQLYPFKLCLIKYESIFLFFKMFIWFLCKSDLRISCFKRSTHSP